MLAPCSLLALSLITSRRTSKLHFVEAGMEFAESNEFVTLFVGFVNLS